MRSRTDAGDSSVPYGQAMTLRTPPEILLEISYAYATSRALHVVAEAGVADVLGEAPCTVEELAGQTGLDPDALGRLLRLLEERSVFRRVDGGGWAHTDASRLLRRDHPSSLRGFARMTGTAFSWDSFTNLGHSARTGESGSTFLHPDGWVAYLQAHPAEAQIFQEAMTAKAHGDVAAALAVHDFTRYRRICDVGGGNGHLLRAIRAAHPEITGVNFELPSVASQLTPEGGIEIVTGDFFVDPLPLADAYVLMNIIHDWDDKSAIAILEAVAAAGRDSRSTVLLLEALLPEGPEPHWSKTLDVVMLAITGGRERTLGEYAALLDTAGLRLDAMTPTATPFSVIEASVAS
jgi:hypothetical protein